MAVGILAVVIAGYQAAFWNPSKASASSDAAPTSVIRMITPGTPAYIVVTATPMPTIQPTYTPYPTYTPVVLNREVVKVVTATPLPTVVPTYTPYPTPVPEVRYVQVPGTCPTVAPAPTVAVTPAPAPGVLRVCWSVSSVKEVYADGRGVAGSGCADYVLPVGKSSHTIEVNR